METIEEFLARGGEITRVRPALGAPVIYGRSLFQRAKRGEL